MKKYILLAVCIINALSCMEQPLITHKPQREPREWDAQAYDKNNKVQTNAFLDFLETNKIKIENKTILDVGCGTGSIPAILAQKARYIHGFDASNNMINFAQNKYKDVKNLSFEQCFAEDFTPNKCYDLALASFCIHWFEDKKRALQNINKSLKMNGEFFATVSTNNNPKPFNLIAAEKIIEKFFFFLSYFNIDLTGCSFASNEEFKTMFNEAGFDIIAIKEQSLDGTISENELRESLWPIASSRPIIKYIPDSLVQKFFDYYVDECRSQLSKTDDNKMSYKIFTTIIHARKIKK